MGGPSHDCNLSPISLIRDAEEIITCIALSSKLEVMKLDLGGNKVNVVDNLKDTWRNK